MEDIYPKEVSREVLQVFELYEGNGEFFDLSKLPVQRESFSFGGCKDTTEAYVITDRCQGCKECYIRCPQDCIDITQTPFVINEEHCIRCGNCKEACSFGAVEKR